MILTSSKAREVGGRMREALQKRGFVRGDEHMLQEVWMHEDGRQVVLTLVEHSMSVTGAPVEAEVSDPRFRPDVEVAYNSKGLVVLLDREEDDAVATNEEGHGEEGSDSRVDDREADVEASDPGSRSAGRDAGGGGAGG